MKTRRTLAALALLSTLGATATSYGDTLRAESANVTRVGCFAEGSGQSTCFASLSESIGPSACSSTSVRWDGDAANGRNVLSVFTAAQLAGKKVTVAVSSSSSDCYEGKYPKVLWVRMNN